MSIPKTVMIFLLKRRVKPFSRRERDAALSAAIDFTRTVCYKEGARQAGRFH
jgi:hypothetical protein